MARNARPPFIGRVIYSFQPQREGELQLNVGELALAIRNENRYWFYGQVATKYGLFPASHLTPVPWPKALPGQKYFCSISDFSQLEPGDLPFSKGEIIVGIESIDSCWWSGRNSLGYKGIFPTALVWAVDIDTKEVGSGEESSFFRRRALVIEDLVAQLPEELNLKKGEELVVTNVVEDGWYRGELNGKSGTFPAGFVVFLDETVDDAQEDVAQSTPITPMIRQDPSTRPLLDTRPHGIASYDYKGRYEDELTLVEGQIVYLLKHVNSDWMQGYDTHGRVGIFPTAFIDMKIDCEVVDTASTQIDCNPSASSLVPKAPSACFLNSVIEKNLNEFLSAPETPSRCSVSNPPPLPPRVLAVQTRLQSNAAERLRNDPKPLATQKEMSPLTCLPDDFLTNKCRQQQLEHTTHEPTKVVLKRDATEDSAPQKRTSYTRPAPLPPLEGPTSSSPADWNLIQSLPTRPILPPPGNHDRVEVRRERIEHENQNRMDDEQLRTLEIRKKLDEHRDNVIIELVVTEREFCRDMRLTCQVFHIEEPNYLERNGIDAALLFGNIAEVIRLSERLINLLIGLTEKSPHNAASVGSAFIELEPEFRRVYGLYCTNHDDAQSLLEKYETAPNTSQFLEQGVLKLRERIVCFNMGSVIIKPVQRILKYPLILSELIKFTDESHPDKKKLEEAALLMTNVASFINESKRKKEIVLKYRDSGLEESLSRKISRINLHSVVKKSSRISMLLKTTLGMAPMNRDSAFDEVESHFNEVVRVLQTSLRDINCVCEQFKMTSQVQFNISETVASFYGDRSRVPVIDNFRTAQRMIFTQHWMAFDSYVIQHVRNPLAALCEACQGPERLVQKRRDKLLDFNIASERLSKNKDPYLKRMLQEEQNLARNTYVALNSQLIEELPVITEHGYKIFRRCLSSFLHARKLFVGRTTKELLDLIEMPEIADLKGDIIEDFDQAHSRVVERISSISFISRTFRSSIASGGGTSLSQSPKSVSSPKSLIEKTPSEQKLIVQTFETINLLRSKFSGEQLFMVSSRCEIKQVLDLEANTGLIVAVIKKEDPMGNKNRWFVDTGDVHGFLPAKNLVPVGDRVLRAESSALETSSAESHFGSYNSFESFNEPFQPMDNATKVTDRGGSVLPLHDLPPSYEEVAGINRHSFTGAEDSTIHTYCEIDDDLLFGSGRERRVVAATNVTTTTTDSASITSHNNFNNSSRDIYEPIDQIGSPTCADIPHQSSTESCNETSYQVFKVEYAFQQRSPLEIGLTEGELVKVLARQDVAGNPDWWLVQNNAGAQGYAPATYLSQLTTKHAPHSFS